jgi:hypothetical protein
MVSVSQVISCVLYPHQVPQLLIYDYVLHAPLSVVSVIRISQTMRYIGTFLPVRGTQTKRRPCPQPVRVCLDVSVIERASVPAGNHAMHKLCSLVGHTSDPSVSFFKKSNIRARALIVWVSEGVGACASCIPGRRVLCSVFADAHKLMPKKEAV